MYIIDTTCFDECFLFPVITGRRYFYTNLSLPRGLVQSPSCCVPWNKCFERSPHFNPLFPQKHYNITNVQIIKVKRTIIALTTTKFTTKSFKHNCRKFKSKNTQFFLNLQTYEEETDQTDLSQRNKSNEYVNSAHINSKVTDVKWPKGTVFAIVGDSIITELLKTDKHNVKVRLFRRRRWRHGR